MTKGVAWAGPGAVVAGAAPADAASQYYFLNGWLRFDRRCDGWTGASTITITGQPSSFTGGGTQDLGLWVFAPPGTAAPTMPYIIFYIGNQIGPVTWSHAAASSWSLPTPTSELPKTGYRAYETTYNGTWTYNTTHQAWVATSAPSFSGTARAETCRGVPLTVYRSVFINNQVYSFERSIFI